MPPSTAPNNTADGTETRVKATLVTSVTTSTRAAAWAGVRARPDIAGQRRCATLRGTNDLGARRHLVPALNERSFTRETWVGRGGGATVPARSRAASARAGVPSRPAV